MKTDINFSKFDIVKFNSNAAILKTSPNAADFFGLVREIGNKTSFIEWYNKKSKTSTAEALSDYTWVSNNDLERVGSLYHMLSSSLTPAQTLVASVAPAATATENKPKRKYTRKAGAAKPGPKPKATKAVKTPKAPKAAKPAKEEKPSVIYVERPVDSRYNMPITLDHQYSWTKKRVLATGKFDNFFKREDIVKSISDAGGLYYNKIDWNLDFAIVGKKPGPAKMEKFARMRIPTITEEQWLALIGDPIYKFADEQETA